MAYNAPTATSCPYVPMLYSSRYHWTLWGWLVLPVPYCFYGVCYLACCCGRVLPPPEDLCYGPVDPPIVNDII